MIALILILFTPFAPSLLGLVPAQKSISDVTSCFWWPAPSRTKICNRVYIEPVVGTGLFNSSVYSSRKVSLSTHDLQHWFAQAELWTLTRSLHNVLQVTMVMGLVKSLKYHGDYKDFGRPAALGNFMSRDETS